MKIVPRTIEKNMAVSCGDTVLRVTPISASGISILYIAKAALKGIRRVRPHF